MDNLTIKNITKLLKSFSKGHMLPPQPPSELIEKPIELNSDLPLPYGWKQWLHTQTGELYYVNKQIGESINKDLCKPRDLSGKYYFHPSSNCIFGNSETLRKGKCHEENRRSVDSTFLASSSSGNATNYSGYLITVECKFCQSYIMVSRETKNCPKCRGEIVAFDNSECN